MSPLRTQQNVDARERIRQKILLDHRPGELISENELMRDLGLSRTPVREALAGLQGEGLIEILPKRGTLIRKLGTDEIRAILDLRRLIETRVAQRLATEIVKRVELRAMAETQLRNILKKMRSLATSKGPIDAARTEAFWRADIEFHALICSLALYEPAADLVRRFQNQLRLVAMRSLYSRQQLKDVVAEHETIFNALLAGASQKHKKALRDAVRLHLRQAKRRWFFTPVS